MAIEAFMRPAGCSCNWEAVTTFADPAEMIERTMTDPDCPVHAKG
ncbi:hypothetical protein QFZ79_002901 [Arthrobacter sp. V4I6]|nr:hypothetical protein [Arthrobacter sp. V4I6]MDQ0854790.1 hypothetical protein [Arthrobacter sp. V4I6]